MSVAVEQAGIDYHVVLAQNALAQCLDVAELQDELASVLARQTTPHTHSKHGVQVLAHASPASARRTPKLNVKAAKLKNVSWVLFFWLCLEWLMVGGLTFKNKLEISRSG